jgi:Predicted N-acetylglucosamine kinase
MIGLVESGATKAHWVFLEGGNVVYETYTVGLNPNSVPFEKMNAAFVGVKETIQSMAPVTRIFFYGAGCHSQIGAQRVDSLLSSHFPSSIISIKSDLVAAGIAVYGKGSGVVCILGTGSSCCYYSNGTVIYVAPSLGYLLGDEGGGTYLGRELLRAFTYDLLPSELKKSFVAKYPTEEIVINLYKSEAPAGYLAQYVPFLISNYSHPFVQQLVRDAFDRYFQFQVIPLCEKSKEVSIGLVGSVGTLFFPIFESLGVEKGLCITKVVQYPINALIQFHKV